MKRLNLLPNSEVIYEDPAYGLDRNICCPYEGTLTPDQKAFNESMSKARVSVEWNYARVLARFGGLRMAKAFKLHLSPIGLY